MRMVVVFVSLLMLSGQSQVLAQGAGANADPALISVLGQIRHEASKSNNGENYAVSAFSFLVKANNFFLTAIAGLAVEDPTKTASTLRTAKRNYNLASRLLRSAVESGVWQMPVAQRSVNIGLGTNATRADILTKISELTDNASEALEDVLMSKDVHKNMASVFDHSAQIGAAIGAFHGV